MPHIPATRLASPFEPLNDSWRIDWRSQGLG